MLVSLLGAALVALAPAQDTDTTVSVQRGARLTLENYAGEVTIRTWDRGAVRIQAGHSARDEVEIDVSPGSVRIEGHGRHGAPRPIDYVLTVPAWMPVAVEGVYTDVVIEGTQAEVNVETVGGDVRVRGGSGYVALSSVEGAVRLERARGRVALNSVNEGVYLADVEGQVAVTAVNGDVTLERVRSDHVEVETVNGDVWFDGAIRRGGGYRFATHNGDVTVVVPDGTGADVSVDTFNGEFESDFPVQLTESRRKRFRFTLGGGGARVELQSFQGEIRLARPGAARRDTGGKAKSKREHEN
ncbi:MAG TPA: DUF4097 family beta strand repeat-containing protein [Gemmatimonadales bacterium]|nr:DUF4097 family beta strand repeat-containing protein [Gemmatimonadales bacterium]